MPQCFWIILYDALLKSYLNDYIITGPRRLVGRYWVRHRSILMISDIKIDADLLGIKIALVPGFMTSLIHGPSPSPSPGPPPGLPCAPGGRLFPFLGVLMGYLGLYSLLKWIAIILVFGTPNVDINASYLRYLP